MRILVAGAGALGGLIGAALTESGEEVTLVEANQARARLLNESGLNISEVGQGERCVRIHVVSSVGAMSPVDLVFVAVKSYQTAEAIEACRPAIGPRTWVLSLQNGIGNTEIIAGLLGPERVLCGITYHSIQHVGPNRIRYRPGIKPIQIAPSAGDVTPEIEAIGQVFQRAGLKTDVVRNIDHVIWQKLLHNAVVNPVSALTGLTCREILEDEHLQGFMRELCMEIVRVMQARGVPIVDAEDPYRPVIQSQKALGKNRPSMWQDLARGNCTEVDAINGAIVEAARQLGLETPHNRALTQFIHSREQQRILKKQEVAQTLEAVVQSTAARQMRPTPLAPEAAMPNERVALKTAPKLKELLREHFLDLQAAADDPRRRIAWCSGLGPVELLRALGMTPYFPEHHAVLLGASGQSGKYIARAFSEGFSQLASSAMTSDIGAMLVGDSPLVSMYGINGPPRPDVLVYSTNIGQRVIQWFEYYERHYRVPLLGLHPPTALRDLTDIEVGAVVQQIHHLIPDLERLSGERLDFDRLAEIVDYSSRAAALWGDILDLARNVPSPLTFFDMLIHLAPMVLMRGTQRAVEYYSILKAELEDRVAQRIAAVPGERFRFYWEGPPIWCALRPLMDLFVRHRTAIVGATYGHLFVLDKLDRDNPIESMARAYTETFPNRADAHKAFFLASQFEKYGVDAAIYHDARTAPEYSNVRYGLEVRLRRATGLPSVVIEADTHDLRLFSLNQLERQLREFVEHQDSASAAASP